MADAPSYVFREAVAADLDAIVAMLSDDPLGAEREHPDGGSAACYRHAFRQIEADPNNAVIVVEAEGALLGCLQLTMIPGLSRAGMMRAQIESVRIAASQRGRGLGRVMFEWAIAEARTRGAGLVQLTTDNSRPDAKRFYEGLGFVATHHGMKLALEP